MPCTTLLIQQCKGIPSKRHIICCKYFALKEYSHPKLPACQTACRNTQMRTNCTFYHCKQNPVTSHPARLSKLPGFLQGKVISHQERTAKLHNKGSKVCLLGLGLVCCCFLICLWIEAFFPKSELIFLWKSLSSECLSCKAAAQQTASIPAAR